MSALPRSSAGQPFALHLGGELARSAGPRSGECGPTMCGSSVDEVDLDDLVVERPRGRPRPRDRRTRCARYCLGQRGDSARSVARRYAAIRSSKGKSEVVAPSSAPMLQIVALPVALIDSAPGAEVLDDLVGAALDGQQPAEIGDDVLGRRPAGQLAGEVHADELRDASTSHGSPAITSPQSAPPTPMASMPRPPALGVCESVPIISAAREGVVLQHDLVDDARARLPEADAVLARGRAQEVVDLARSR